MEFWSFNNELGVCNIMFRYPVQISCSDMTM